MPFTTGDVRAGLRGLRREWALLGALTSCIHAPSPQPSVPPLYPSPGFGRAGCYAGPGLEQFSNEPLTRGSKGARAGPWLILDSLTAQEAFTVGTSAIPTDSVWRQSTIVFADDTTMTITGVWVRPARDSIAVYVPRSHPPVRWQFRVEGTDLVGEGLMRSDLVRVLPDGRRIAPTNAWLVRLMRVSCGIVPRNRAQQLLQVGRE